MRDEFGDKDDLRQSFDKVPELSFSTELRERILKQAAIQDTRSRRGEKRPRVRKTTTWVAGLTGVVAACFLVGILVANLGSSQPSQPRVTAARHPALSDHAFGLVQAPIKVLSYQVLPPISSGGSAVLEATIENTGSSPLSRKDVFAVVSFDDLSGTSLPQNQLTESKFLSFADGPNPTLEPGATMSWTYQLFGVPFVNQDRSSLQPEVNFYYSALSSTKYTVAWQEATGIQISGVTSKPNVPVADGYSVVVHAVLQNTTNQKVSTTGLAAIVDYGQSFTDWRSVRFLNSIDGAADPVIPAHGQLSVTFHLIGPNVPLFVHGTPEIRLIWKTSKQG